MWIFTSPRGKMQSYQESWLKHKLYCTVHSGKYALSVCILYNILISYILCINLERNFLGLHVKGRVFFSFILLYLAGLWKKLVLCKPKKFCFQNLHLLNNYFFSIFTIKSDKDLIKPSVNDYTALLKEKEVLQRVLRLSRGSTV